MTLKDIPLHMIRSRPGNRARGGFDEDALQGLAESIKDQGLLQPITVRPLATDDDAAYELVSGDRRCRAAKIVGLKEVPAIIAPEDATEEWAELAAIAENVQRVGLHPLDEMASYVRLRELGLSTKDVVERVGRSADHVRARLKLENLIPEIRDLYMQGHGGLGVAEAISRLPQEYQYKPILVNIQKDMKRTEESGVSVRLNANQIRWWVVEDTLLLESAPFDIEDAELTDAPKCGECPLRIVHDQFGFFHDDVMEGDRCGSKRCWKSKVAAHVDRAREQLVADGVKFIEATEQYTVPQKQVGKKWGGSDWTEADPTKSKRGTRTVLRIDGENAGEVVRGRKIQRHHDGSSYMDKWRKQERKNEQGKAIRKAKWMNLVKAGGEVLAGRSDVRWAILDSVLTYESKLFLCEYFGLEIVQDPKEHWRDNRHEVFEEFLQSAVPEPQIMTMVAMAVVAEFVDARVYEDDEREGKGKIPPTTLLDVLCKEWEITVDEEAIIASLDKEQEADDEVDRAAEEDEPTEAAGD